MIGKLCFVLTLVILLIVFAFRGFTFSESNRPGEELSTSTRLIVIITILIFALAIVDVALKSPFKMKSGLYKPTLARPVYILYAIYFASLCYTALIHKENFTLGLDLFTKLTFCILLWFVFSISLKTIKYAKIALTVIVIGSLITSIYTNILYFNAGFYTRYHGFYGGVNVLGRNTAIAIVIVFAFLLSSNSLFKRVIFSAIIASLVLTLFLNGSRGGLVAAIVGITSLFFCLSLLTRLPRKYTMSVFLVIIVFLCIAYYLGNQSTLFANRYLYGALQTESVTRRVQIYQAGTAMFLQHPFIGVGLGNYTPMTGAIHPHNLLLDISLSAGVLALVSFLFIIIKMVKTSLRYIKQLRNHELSFLIAIFLSVLFVILTSASFSQHLVNVFTLWIFIAILGNILYIAERYVINAHLRNVSSKAGVAKEKLRVMK